jgi:peptidoglycan/LPS O-acetylase OafA/YrhL
MPSDDRATDPLSRILTFARDIGWTGVDLFFVLSGFLISGLLFRELTAFGSIRIGRFLLRRGAKIWPSYFFVFGVWVVARMCAIGIGQHQPAQAGSLLLSSLPNVVFIQNYWPMAIRWPHSWSLAIEEHFYAVLPLTLMYLASRRRLKAVPALCVGAITAIMLLRCWLRYGHGYSFDQLYYPTHLRVDGLTTGVLIGHIRQNRPGIFSAVGARCRRLLPIVLLVPALVVAFPRSTSGVVPTVGFTIFALLFGIAVAAAGFDPNMFAGRFTRLLAEPLRRMGVYSYTIYLTHSVIFEFPGLSRYLLSMGSRFGIHAGQIVFLVSSVVSGVLVSLLVEQPILRLRESFLPSRKSLLG